MTIENKPFIFGVATSGDTWKIAQNKGCNIVVCIDEFQQIAEFKDAKTFQKRLRSIWQLQKSVSYCLFGSKKHLMNELFEKKSLPFYKFSDAIYLSKIGTHNWVDISFVLFVWGGQSVQWSVYFLIYKWNIFLNLRRLVKRSIIFADFRKNYRT